MLVGFDSGDADFDILEETGGAKTVTLTEAQMPVHTHTQNAHGHSVTDPGHTHLTQRYPTATGGNSGFTIDTSMSGTPADNSLATKTNTTGVTVQNATAVNQNAGSGEAHTNLPPFLVVHFWKRTA
jgi:microcystin-dependent protein